MTESAPQPSVKGRPLATKLARVLAEVARVPKNGRNDFHNYDYVTESDLVDHIRGKLAEQGVAIFPSVIDATTKEVEDARKRKNYLTTVSLKITLIDGESGDVMTTVWCGQGADASDKSYYKAYTGAMKYFLMKTFLIGTGDDPENDSVTQNNQPSSHTLGHEFIDMVYATGADEVACHRFLVKCAGGGRVTELPINKLQNMLNAFSDKTVEQRIEAIHKTEK